MSRIFEYYLDIFEKYFIGEFDADSCGFEVKSSYSSGHIKEIELSRPQKLKNYKNIDENGRVSFHDNGNIKKVCLNSPQAVKTFLGDILVSEVTFSESGRIGEFDIVCEMVLRDKLIGSPLKKTIKIENTVFVVIAFATTGLSLENGDDICEISAVKLVNGEVTETFTRLVNPDCPISPSATAVNKITNDIVKNAPKFEQIYNEFISFISNGVIVGFYLPFHFSFLNAKLKNLGKPELENNTLDTQLLIKKIWPNFYFVSLADLKSKLSLEIRDEQASLDKVFTIAALFNKIIEYYKKNGKTEIDDPEKDTKTTDDILL